MRPKAPATYDCTGKRDLYASIGVGEYWRYDPTGGEYYGVPLIGERLVAGEYQPLEMYENENGDTWGHSPALDIDIYWGDDRLRIFSPERGRFISDTMQRETEALEQEAEISALSAAYEAERAARLASERARRAAENEVRRLQEQLRRQSE